MVAYPSSLDAFPNPTATTKRNATGFEHADQHADANDAIEALEAKLGIGATTPDAQFKSVVATAVGTTAWGYSAMVKLGEASGTGASGVLSFTSIPSGFRTLMIAFAGRSDAAGSGGANVRLTFEASPTAGAYNHQIITAGNATVAGSENIGVSDFMTVALIPTAGATANLQGSGTIWVPEYANTVVMKAPHGITTSPTEISSGNLGARLWSGIYENLAAISVVRLTLNTGNWTTTSRATLFGLPAA